MPQLILYTPDELLAIRGIGTRALDGIGLALLVHGYSLRGDSEATS